MNSTKKCSKAMNNNKNKLTKNKLSKHNTKQKNLLRQKLYNFLTTIVMWQSLINEKKNSVQMCK